MHALFSRKATRNPLMCQRISSRKQGKRQPFGRRLWKTVEVGAEGHSGAPGTETVYLAYSDEGYAAEFRLPGVPAAAPTQGPTSFTYLWVYAPDGLWATDPIAVRTAQGWRYPQADHLAVAQQVIDSAGNVTTVMRMNSYGDALVRGEPLPSRFPGQLNDVETGLNYNYFRNYDPQLGRYIQRDPIGLRGGLNVYRYVDANPTKFVDPLGLIGTCTLVARWNGMPRHKILETPIGEGEWRLRGATAQFAQGRLLLGRIPLPGKLMANCFAVFVQNYQETKRSYATRYSIYYCVEYGCEGWSFDVRTEETTVFLGETRRNYERVLRTDTAYVAIRAEGDAYSACLGNL